jgi:hypothetical protein
VWATSPQIMLHPKHLNRVQFFSHLFLLVEKGSRIFN